MEITMDVKQSGLDKLDEAFKEAQEPGWLETPSMKSPHSKEYKEWANELIENRRYIFHYLMDMYGSWSENGDSLPKGRFKITQTTEAEITLKQI